MRESRLTVNGIKVRLGSYAAELEYVAYETPHYPWNVPTHSHKSFEIHFIGKGSGKLTTDSGEYELSGGMMYITGPGVMHSQSSGSEDPMDEYCLTVGFRKSDRILPDDDITTDQIVKNLLSEPFFIADSDLGCPELILSMIRELSFTPPGWRDRTRLLLSDVVLRVLRLVSKVDTPTLALPTGETLVDGVNYFAIIERALIRFRCPESEESLARRLHISRRHLNRLMRQYYQMTYKEKINRLRVESAKRLLILTDLPIADISDRVGFSTVQYFIRIFSGTVGVPPGLYRRENREKEESSLSATDEGSTEP